MISGVSIHTDFYFQNANAQAYFLQCRRPRFDSWVRMIPWRRDRLLIPVFFQWASLVAQIVKNPLAIQEIWVWNLGWEDPLEEDTTTLSSIVA